MTADSQPADVVGFAYPSQCRPATVAALKGATCSLSGAVMLATLSGTYDDQTTQRYLLATDKNCATAIPAEVVNKPSAQLPGYLQSMPADIVAAAAKRSRNGAAGCVVTIADNRATAHTNKGEISETLLDPDAHYGMVRCLAEMFANPPVTEGRIRLDAKRLAAIAKALGSDAVEISWSDSERNPLQIRPIATRSGDAVVEGARGLLMPISEA